MLVKDIRNKFIEKLKNNDIVRNPRDNKLMLEIIGASFIADEDSIFGVPNQDYIKREIEWYQSQSLNVNDIPGDNVPQAWQFTANEDGFINSNYGWLILNSGNHNQYDNALAELKRDPASRRATMIYQRPSMWSDWSAQDKNDFVCTNAVTYYIRDNTLHCVVQMRSNDVVFGYKNDYAWQNFVLHSLVRDLLSIYPNLKPGNIHWQVQNLHVYERHFNLVTL